MDFIPRLEKIKCVNNEWCLTWLWFCVSTYSSARLQFTIELSLKYFVIRFYIPFIKFRFGIPFSEYLYLKYSRYSQENNEAQ